MNTSDNDSLPATAKIILDGWTLSIKHHNVSNMDGMFSALLYVIKWYDSMRWNEMVLQMERQGVHYNTVIKHCVNEVTADFRKFAQFMKYYCDVEGEYTSIILFAKSPGCGEIATRITDKILECRDWDEFYGEMNLKNDFWSDVVATIRDEWKKYYNKTVT